MPDSAIYSEAADGRPFFLIPWNQQFLAGTTEVPQDSDPGTAAPSQAEVDYLMSSVRRVLPRLKISQSDILFTFSGVRPLPFSPGEEAAAITRRHLWHDHSDEEVAGMFSLIGGKLTTAARVGREGARKLGFSVPKPAIAVITSSVDFAAAQKQHATELGQAAGISRASALAILEWFGPRSTAIAQLAASSPSTRLPICGHTEHIVAEAVYSVQTEYAQTLADILLRRVPVALSAHWSDGCSTAAAARIGEALAWSEHDVAKQRDSFQQERRCLLGV
jgi:glycerol-3-phosphate dehydrogenase